MIFLILVLLLGGLHGIEAYPITVTSTVGGHVKITCSHVNAFNNIKYFCKGACRDEDVLIRSEGKIKLSKGKYSIQDEGNTFYVTITELEETDSGTYWCGIDRFGMDTYNMVHLKVTKATKTSQPPPVKDATTANVTAAGHTRDPKGAIIHLSSPEANSEALSDKLVYIGAGLGVAVLVLAFALLVFIRKRNTIRRTITTSSGKDHETVYAVSNQQRDVDCDVTTYDNLQAASGGNTIRNSSAVHHQDTSRDTDMIYSNVSMSSESQTPAENLLYSTVTFNTDRDSALTTRTASVMYSTIKNNVSGGGNDETTAYDFHCV